MSSELRVMLDKASGNGSQSLLQVIEMSVVEKRKRLGWQEQDMETREIIGQWIDERPSLGDKITLYRQGDKLFLETWYNDGCHSLDEMQATRLDNGLKLEDLGGNLFGEYFLLSDDNNLQFCNSSECFYTAKRAA
ncbi:hypothetical protein L1D32_04825 [Shewanella insulae]|uniref:Uncharacterized protein n=1 Tax=Shewanella insulae TaxID=2681496 RepID=A0A6L7I227_9GAMM|nr:hypothetical protein [Shewanella insulae]MCG9714200.1 hypothetical protein [Shewanella insulae]MCG9737483.1 hypothetical protein [Shewanella insulae]MCG9754989.1 hypothetical protein [Shewanella insulae]MXR69361.1 hypothetical protein [Shewanella insulae]